MAKLKVREHMVNTSLAFLCIVSYIGKIVKFKAIEIWSYMYSIRMHFYENFSDV